MLAEQTAGLSSCHFGGNNPISFNDPNGDKWTDPMGQTHLGPNLFGLFMPGGVASYYNSIEGGGLFGESGCGGSYAVDGGFAFTGNKARNVFTSLVNSINKAGTDGDWSFSVGQNSKGDIGFWQSFSSIDYNADNGLLDRVTIGNRFVNPS